MSTEEKILDYMDGTLSENESGELLHSLSVSPEKRVVLEQHIKLRELTGLAQKPLAVPQALEASMAERFPAIAEYNRELAGGAMIVGQAARPSIIGRIAATVAAFIAQYPVRTGFAVAAASVIAYFALAGGDKINTTRELATTVNQGSSIGNGESSIVREGNTTNNQSSTLDKGPSAIAKPSDITLRGNNFSHQSNESHAFHLNSSASPKANIPSHRDHIASNRGIPPTKQMKETNNQNVADREHNIPEKPAVTPPENTPAANSKDVADAPNASAVPKNNANDNVKTDNANPAKDVAVATPADDHRSPSVALAENNVHGSSEEQNPFKNKNEVSGFPFAIRLYYGLGQSFINVHQSDATLANRTEAAPLFGIDYIASSQVSIGIEAGSAAISQLITQSAIQSNLNGLPSISRVVINNAVTNSSQWYGRAVIRYTFNPYSLIHWEGTLGAGAAFAGKAAPLVSGALFAGYDLSSKIGISLGVAFAGTWTGANTQNAAAQAVSSGIDPIGYVTTNHATSTLFTPSYAFRIGFKLKPW